MDDYEKLRQMLHTNPAGAPQSETFREILGILFTPDEVRVALGMAFVPRSIEKIADASGVPAQQVAQHCESMADKGIVFSREKNGVMGYALLPTIPGLFEFPFMTGGGTPVHERLARLWEKYHREALGNEFAGSSTPLMRVIPIEKTIQTRNEIVPYEILSGMMESAKTFALAQCACRTSKAACDAPRDVCLIFDSAARFLIERKLAREITSQDAAQVLLRAEEAGLVHTCNNSQDRLTVICNCCPCCCTVIRGLTELGNPNAFARGRWHAQVDEGLCTGCATCQDERCPVEAIEVQDDVAKVNPQRCIGCGLCVSTCPSEALSMVPRQDARVPPATVTEMGMLVLQEKGRLQDYINLNQP
ncbi:MAG: 4Fe-4S binding protein [Deltaproteobacteria bacterium]|nr:4Fe-4S binding protein [Deltaproteobacteria bacterium]